MERRRIEVTQEVVEQRSGRRWANINADCSRVGGTDGGDDDGGGGGGVLVLRVLVPAAQRSATADLSAHWALLDALGPTAEAQ
jgi:hypothetical protein